MSRTDGSYRMMTRLLRDIGRAGEARARPKIPSSTLRRDLRSEVDPFSHSEVGSVRLRVSYYWSLYVHDGRRPFSMPPGRMMVWWRNPRDDPRLRRGITPRRLGQLRRLTKAQFAEALEERRRWIASGGDPYRSPVVITRAVRRPTRPTPFFGNSPGEGMHGFVRDVGTLAQRRVREWILEDALGGSAFDHGEINGRL